MTSSTSYIGSLKSKLPYYTIPSVKMGLVGGALLCIFDAKIMTVILPLFGLSMPSNDANIRILYYNAYNYSTVLFHFLFFAGAIFYGIKGAKRIMPASFLNFKHAFIAGFVAALVALGVFEFNTILYSITGNQIFNISNNLVTIFGYMVTGAICSLIFGAIFKSKPVSEVINIQEQDTSPE